jgi:hypothetical protein
LKRILLIANYRTRILSQWEGKDEISKM